MNNKIVFKLKTPGFNSVQVLNETTFSNELNNTPPIWGLTQIRKITVIEDSGNVLTPEQKSNARLLSNISGCGKITTGIPPYLLGTFNIYFDDFTNISFTTGFNSNYGFGLYKFSGIASGFESYKLTDVNWLSQASGGVDFDEWTITIYKM
jgi:hypothetical protein